jgi:L-ascorbate metabolism protein UlaG (beta-lactamase superfamily)
MGEPYARRLGATGSGSGRIWTGDRYRAQFTELDWWQSAETGGVTITGMYFSGSSGFGEHFKTIGDRLGPFDLSILKIGAYGPRPDVARDPHEPEEAVKAHIALRARRMLPCTGAHSTSSSMPGTSRSRAVAVAAIKASTSSLRVRAIWWLRTRRLRPCAGG